MGGLSSLIVLFENALYPFKVLNVYIGRFFGRFMGGKSRSLSLAARVSLAFFFCIAIFILIAVLLRRFSTAGKYPKVTFTGYEIVDDILYFVIAAGIALLVYFGVRMATRDKPSLYPEIDRCWQSFEGWREKQALDWFDFNRYLVLGTSLPVSKAMHAEMKDKKVDALPGGANEWMHWFGTTENLYLHLKKISHTNERLERIKSRSAGSTSFAGGGTLQVSVGVPGWSEDVSIGGGANTSEVDYGDSVENFGASLDPNDSIDVHDSGSFAKASSSSTDDEADEIEESYGEDDDTRSERIEYLSKLMLSNTSGEVPFHGVVVTLPFDKFIQRENYKAISAAIKKDLLELRESANVAFPVAFVFTSMEKDQGFPKLQNLLGSKRAATGRFGAGCQVEDIPTIDKKNLDLQITRACDSFEDWVINRWSKSSQLARAAQNKELYKLVIRIRQQFQQRLEYLLENSIIWSPSESPNGESADLALAGCYFASTGEHPAERGFLSGVFSKCEEFSETSSWSEKAMSKDRTFSVLSSLLFLLSLVMIVSVGIYMFRSMGA
jgi:hypothetical protein